MATATNVIGALQTDVVTMMWDVFKRLGVEEALLSDPFQLLAEGRGAATAPLAKDHSKQAAKPSETSRVYLVQRKTTCDVGAGICLIQISGRIEETGG